MLHNCLMQEKKRKTSLSGCGLWCWLLWPGYFYVVSGRCIYRYSLRVLENPQTNLATELISEDGVVIATYHRKPLIRTIRRFACGTQTSYRCDRGYSFLPPFRHRLSCVGRVAVKSIYCGNQVQAEAVPLRSKLPKHCIPEIPQYINFPVAMLLKWWS